jgi:very-short-patch-repair endonuclease
LVVELDGSIHLNQAEYDMLRTDQLIEKGYTVIRFNNRTVLENWEEVERIIKEFMIKSNFS